jgi:hypothetical protein
MRPRSVLSLIGINQENDTRNPDAALVRQLRRERYHSALVQG